MSKISKMNSKVFETKIKIKMNKNSFFDCEEDFDLYEEAREFSRERYDSNWNYDDTDYYEDSFYALTDGMCGDYDDGMDLDSVMTYMGLD